jgi:hypothetical protein
MSRRELRQILERRLIEKIVNGVNGTNKKKRTDETDAERYPPIPHALRGFGTDDSLSPPS